MLLNNTTKNVKANPKPLSSSSFALHTQRRRNDRLLRDILQRYNTLDDMLPAVNLLLRQCGKSSRFISRHNAGLLSEVGFCLLSWPEATANEKISSKGRLLVACGLAISGHRIQARCELSKVGSIERGYRRAFLTVRELLESV